MANKPAKIYAFDCEDNGHGKLLYGSIFDGIDHHGFVTIRQFINFINAHPGVYYAHNLGYDMALLELMRVCTCSWRGGRVIEGQYQGNSVFFRDTLNLSFVSLAKLGSEMGYRKLDKDFDNEVFDISPLEKWIKGKHKISFKRIFGRLKRAKELNRKTVMALMDILYCERDTEICWRYADKTREFVKQYGLQRERATLASNAFAIFKSHFCGYELPYEGEEYRNWYMGGRTEAFHIGSVKPGKGEKIYYSDINSLYPYCMTMPYPDDIYMSHEPEEKFWLAEAVIEIDSKCNIPPIPIKRDNKLIFPVGEFKCFTNSIEFEQAKPWIKSYRFNRVYNFRECDTYFREYALEMYSKRKECESPIDNFIYKLYMNSLYGKFGQGGDNEYSVHCVFVSDFENKMRVRSRKFVRKYLNHDGVFFLKEVDSEMYQNLVWASFITAYARTELYKLLTTVESRGGRVLYCDTDSVFYVAKEPLLVDRESNELGDLKSETGSYMEIFGAKEYIFQEQAFCKGIKSEVKADFKRKLSRRKLLYLNGRKVTARKPMKYKELYRRTRIQITESTGYIVQKKKILDPDTGKYKVDQNDNNPDCYFIEFEQNADGIEAKNLKIIKKRKVPKIPPNIWIEIEKQKMGEYNKRIINKNGTTKPIVLGDN